MTPIDIRTVTLQEAFDHAVRGIIWQGGPSIRSQSINKTACAYNGKSKGKATHCAAGWLIGGFDFGGTEIEGEGIGTVLIFSNGDLPDHRTATFLHYMQSAHDTAALMPQSQFWKYFRHLLDPTIKAFKLNADVLNEIPQEEPT